MAEPRRSVLLPGFALLAIAVIIVSVAKARPVRCSPARPADPTPSSMAVGPVTPPAIAPSAPIRPAAGPAAGSAAADPLPTAVAPSAEKMAPVPWTRPPSADPVTGAAGPVTGAVDPVTALTAACSPTEIDLLSRLSRRRLTPDARIQRVLARLRAGETPAAVLAILPELWRDARLPERRGQQVVEAWLRELADLPAAVADGPVEDDGPAVEALVPIGRR